jgi:hypothetical protein
VLARRHAQLLGADDDLVVHVRHVLHERQVVAALQPAPDDLEGQRRAPVPDVGVVVHRQPAQVEPDLAARGVERDERLLAAGADVVGLEGHAHATGLRVKNCAAGWGGCLRYG